MKIPVKVGHGLRICFILGMNCGDTTSTAELARCVPVTPKYLEKILNKLLKEGIVSAKRGATGGYALAKPSDQITAGEIFKALDEHSDMIDCVAGTCNDAYCPNRGLMKRLHQSVSQVLDHYSVQDMINDNTCLGGGRNESIS